MAIAAARVIATYPRFCQTFDEPVHIAMGLEWLDRGSYTLELQHPPLARVFDALLLRGRYPAGAIRLTDPQLPVRVGNAILDGGEAYQGNLTLARLGVLPFLFLGSLIVFLWTRAIADPIAAAAAVALFTLVPPILGHAGVATTDLALAATLPAAVFALVRAAERPSALRIALLAFALAAAVLTKFSAIPFLGAIAMAVVVMKRPSARVALALPAAALLVWAGYRFSIWPAPLYGFPPRAILGMLAQSGSAPDRAFLFLLTHVRLPAPEFFAGLTHLAEHGSAGHASYFLGSVRTQGTWLFFPVLIAVKTPIAFMILAAIGLRRAAVPAISAGLIVLVAMLARINLGVRHVLPIYPLLAIGGGIALVAIWRRRRAFAAILGAWLAISGLLAHPDYLSYFNELAGRHPERIVVDSDLDWGQDLPRLREAIAQRGVDHLWLAYFGTTDLAAYPLGAPVRALPPRMPVKGWVAVSRTLLAGAYGTDYSWLQSMKPTAEIGRSMLLYRIE